LRVYYTNNSITVFPVYQIGRDANENLEGLGRKIKFWLTRDNKPYLFKVEGRGTGEDWAEKVVCELARELGLPHAEYDLAEWDSPNGKIPGVITDKLQSPSQRLEMGNQLLFKIDPDYPAGKKYGVRKHTVGAVIEVLKNLKEPAPEWMKRAPQAIQTALDVFVGYIMLDAWVANQDRHHENWGAIQEEDFWRLAPTFDHGAALARNETDESREKKLKTKDKNGNVYAFASRARSAMFEKETDHKTLLAMRVFEIFAINSPSAAQAWLEQLSKVRPEKIRGLLEMVPAHRMTRTTRDFTFELLKNNQQRLLEVALKL
jgi:hypothetical protein